MLKEFLKLPSSWQTYLQPEMEDPNMQSLGAFLREESKQGVTVYPAHCDVFAALNASPLDKTCVVILGQDPYHGPNQAHGLSFSVPDGERVPPSLKNIYKELKTDLGCEISENGYLMPWAEQGVLLLNSVLTVRHGNAGSHQGKGWEQFTDTVINLVSSQQSAVVFMLWGAYAQKKGKEIDRTKHLVLEAPHPSPLSAHRGFLGCKHFSQANAYLRSKGKQAIDWQITASRQIELLS